MSLQPLQYNLSAWATGTFRQRVTLLQGDESSPPQNLGGYTAQMVILDKVDGNVLYTASTSNGGVTLGGIAGTIDMYIPASVTSTWEWPQGVYYLTITDAGNTNDVIPLLWGRFTVSDIA